MSINESPSPWPLSGPRYATFLALTFPDGEVITTIWSWPMQPAPTTLPAEIKLDNPSSESPLL